LCSASHEYNLPPNLSTMFKTFLENSPQEFWKYTAISMSNSKYCKIKSKKMQAQQFLLKSFVIYTLGFANNWLVNVTSFPVISKDQDEKQISRFSKDINLQYSL